MFALFYSNWFLLVFDFFFQQQCHIYICARLLWFLSFFLCRLAAVIVRLCLLRYIHLLHTCCFSVVVFCFSLCKLFASFKCMNVNICVIVVNRSAAGYSHTKLCMLCCCCSFSGVSEWCVSMPAFFALMQLFFSVQFKWLEFINDRWSVWADYGVQLFFLFFLWTFCAQDSCHFALYRCRRQLSLGFIRSHCLHHSLRTE